MPSCQKANFVPYVMPYSTGSTYQKIRVFFFASSSSASCIMMSMFPRNCERWSVKSATSYRLGLFLDSAGWSIELKFGVPIAKFVPLADIGSIKGLGLNFAVSAAQLLRHESSVHIFGTTVVLFSHSKSNFFVFWNGFF
jgi:hypothetical protein